MNGTPLRDYRDPLIELPVGLAPPHLRPGSGPSADRARIVQRQERARALEQIFGLSLHTLTVSDHERALDVFDHMFLEFYRDDAEVRDELRGRAFARAVRLLRDLAKVQS